MRDEQRQILEMLHAGKITAAQAEQLLRALGQDGAPTRPPAPPPTLPQDARPFRPVWEIPFGAGIGLLGLAGSALLRGRGRRSVIGSLFLWMLALLAGLLAAVGWWSRGARWMHLRITEPGGKKRRLSLPLPIGAARWALELAQRTADEDAAEKLALVASLLSIGPRAPGGDPVTVEVDDDEGRHIEISIG